MRDIPIIYSAPMVRALWDDRKFMTRRLAWTTRKTKVTEADGQSNVIPMATASSWQRVQPGDRLWVREGLEIGKSRIGWQYRADAVPIRMMNDDPRVTQMIAWAHHRERDHCTAIHMPRWASRLTLIVRATKIERLQEIKEAECIAEGCKVIRLAGNPVDDEPMVRLEPSHVYGTPRTWFRELWDSLHGKGAWDGNPEVVALTFIVHKHNIDALPKAVAA